MMLRSSAYTWSKLHPRATEDHLGAIQWFIKHEDPRPAREQINERYAHGGGYMPYGGQSWKYDAEKKELRYEDDPDVLPALWMTEHRGVEVIVFQHALVMLREKATGLFSVARLD